MIAFQSTSTILLRRRHIPFWCMHKCSQYLTPVVCFEVSFMVTVLQYKAHPLSMSLGLRLNRRNVLIWIFNECLEMLLFHTGFRLFHYHHYLRFEKQSEVEPISTLFLTSLQQPKYPDAHSNLKCNLSWIRIRCPHTNQISTSNLQSMPHYLLNNSGGSDSLCSAAFRLASIKQFSSTARRHEAYVNPICHQPEVRSLNSQFS